MLRRLLEDSGGHVIIADGAASALALLPSVRPDVLVSDIGMPHVDGYELLRRIRRLGPAQGGALPAIALTAFARPEDRKLALDAGFLAHVTKPVEPAEIIAVVAAIGGRAA